MPSPFPGIDPFIEGHLWSDFHTRFITALSEDLISKVMPRYTALIEERVYVERESEQPRLFLKPDVAVVPEAVTRSARQSAPPSQQPLQVPIYFPETVRERFIEIRLKDGREIVTIVELLSPSNKRPYSDGRREYLEKRTVVHLGMTHMVELDLLRGGERLPMAGPLPPAYGYAIVSDSRRRPMADVWPVSLREPLPTISVPLADGDPSVAVNLQEVFEDVYRRAGYDYALHHDAPLEPKMGEEDAAWVRDVLQGGAG